jgi:uncharacterized protein YutD
MKTQFTIALLMFISGGVVGCVSSTNFTLTKNDLTSRDMYDLYIQQEISHLKLADLKKIELERDDKFPTQEILDKKQKESIEGQKLKFDEYCQNKKQVKAFTVDKTYSLNGEGGEALNAFQMLLEQKKLLKSLDNWIQENNPGQERLAGYYFFPRQAEIDEYMKHGQNFVKAYSDLQCAGYVIRYEGNLRYCMIPEHNDPLSSAIRRGVKSYLSANKDIKKAITGDTVRYLITYDLSGFCEKAMRVE